MNKSAKVKSVIALSLLVLIGLMFFIVALTNEELEAEKALLEQELVDAGYGWLGRLNVEVRDGK